MIACSQVKGGLFICLLVPYRGRLHLLEHFEHWNPTYYGTKLRQAEGFRARGEAQLLKQAFEREIDANAVLQACVLPDMVTAPPTC